MKKVVIERMEYEIDDAEFGYWDTENEEYVPISRDFGVAAERLNCSVELLEAIDMFVDDFKVRIAADLKSLFDRTE